MEEMADLLDLPWAPALIAKCPVLDIIGLLSAMLATQVGVVRVLSRITILHPAKSCSTSVPSISQADWQEAYLHQVYLPTVNNSGRAKHRQHGSAPVPKFKAKYGSVPTISHHFMNSSVPISFVSTPSHASSGRLGRFSRGPTPSSQW